jgi:MFS family permease
VTLSETPAFQAAMARHERARAPLIDVLRSHWLPLIQGSLAIVVCYALFYLSTVFALSYGVNQRHIASTDFLGLLCIAVLFMAAATPIAAWLADRVGRRPVLLAAHGLAALTGLALPALLGGGGAGEILLFLSLALGVMGLTFAPLGALLPELFPTRVAYTGASSAYNLGGILGASLAPSFAQWLLAHGGLAWVGYYIVAAAAISFLSVVSMKETK